MTTLPNSPTITSLSHSAGFGAICTGVDFNALTEEQFKTIEDSLYRHKVLIIKNQAGLRPESQLALNRRFDPLAKGHGAGTNKEVLTRKNITAGKPAVPGVEEVRIIGRREFPPGHFGTTEHLSLAADSHARFHRNPLSQEEIDAGETRFHVWHMDSQLWPVDRHTARVTTFWAYKLPKGPNVKVRFDDETNQPAISVKPGRTAFVDTVAMYNSLSQEDKDWVAHSSVEYAPNPFDWVSPLKLRSNGVGIAPDEAGKEVPFEDLADCDFSRVQILPMLWPNPVTGELALQTHGVPARKLHIKHSSNGPVTIIHDVVEVRRILYDLERPFFTEKNILFAEAMDEGDLVVWNNRAVKHSAVEFPASYGPRLAHQCHLAASDSPAFPTPIPALS